MSTNDVFALKERIFTLEAELVCANAEKVRAMPSAQKRRLESLEAKLSFAQKELNDAKRVKIAATPSSRKPLEKFLSAASESLLRLFSAENGGLSDASNAQVTTTPPRRRSATNEVVRSPPGSRVALKAMASYSTVLNALASQNLDVDSLTDALIDLLTAKKTKTSEVPSHVLQVLNKLREHYPRQHDVAVRRRLDKLGHGFRAVSIPSKRALLSLVAKVLGSCEDGLYGETYPSLVEALCSSYEAKTKPEWTLHLAPYVAKCVKGSSAVKRLAKAWTEHGDCDASALSALVCAHVSEETGTPADLIEHAPNLMGRLIDDAYVGDEVANSISLRAIHLLVTTRESDVITLNHEEQHRLSVALERDGVFGWYKRDLGFLV